METTTNYTNQLNSMKNYESLQGAKDSHTTFTEGFEAIYTKVQEQERSSELVKAFEEKLKKECRF